MRRRVDVSAFEELVERYDCKLLRIAEHITHNREDSQDAVQEAFLKAFQHVGYFRNIRIFMLADPHHRESR